MQPTCGADGTNRPARSSARQSGRLRRRRWLFWCLLLITAAAPGLPRDPVAAAQVLPNAPAPAGTTVEGAVMDRDGDYIPNAQIRLIPNGSESPFQTASTAEGRFHFDAVPSGSFTIEVRASGFSSMTAQGTAAGGVLELPPITLPMAAAAFEINAMTQHEQAEVELKQEEHQRLFGVIPNFGISYNWNAPPLDTGQKFHLVTRFVLDPFTLAESAGQAGLEQAAGVYPEFGSGASGYLKRFGATTADVAIGSELGGAVFPSLMRQDPRYFWKGQGSVRSRTLYALSRAVICRGDNGKDQVCYSAMAGDFSAGAISNLYYPKEDRNGALLTFENGLLDIAYDAIGNVVQEFFFKRITPNAKSLKPALTTESGKR